MPSDRKVANWLEETAQALDAGMNASEAIACSLGNRLNSLEELHQALEEGRNWTEALIEHAHFLSDSEIEILSAADQSGQLPNFMRTLASQRRDIAAAKRRAILAALYPLFIFHFAVLVIPVKHIVAGETNLYLLKVFIILVPTWSLTAFLFGTIKIWPMFGYRLGKIVPLISRFMKFHEIANFTKTLAVCQQAGLPIDRSWQAAARATRRKDLHLATDEALKEINAGISPFARIQLNKTFPTAFKQKYKIGEATGSLDQSLDEAAETFRSSAKASLTAASIVYPVLLFGIAAAFVIINIFISFIRDYLGVYENFEM